MSFLCSITFIFKKVRHNWITVANQQLSFVKDGKEYIPYWADIKAMYEEDRKNSM